MYFSCKKKEAKRAFFCGWETIKPIAPNLREKKRYLTYEVSSTKKLQSADVKSAVQLGLQSFMGAFGCAKAGVILVENTAKKGIIKVQVKYVDQAKTALALIKEISKQKVIIKTINVSGMLHQAKKGGLKKHATNWRNFASSDGIW